MKGVMKRLANLPLRKSRFAPAHFLWLARQRRGGRVSVKKYPVRIPTDDGTLAMSS